ncbi:MAG TPA: hypothetical protein IAC56_04815 [Candidatus Aphodousia faecigallinarum]|uniref:Uncharacterized protein n=1 Tax=Candidatus Aphodousia faecigallinarum TaxID=2840677 RepID=A0A9D1IIK2_9BURK|nr:hypothetical protein [Candidatus Aphodousia faecigallinarum]
MDVFFLFNLSEQGHSVVLVFVLAAVLAVVEIWSLKNRRAKAYHALLREARARLSEMQLRIN